MDNTNQNTQSFLTLQIIHGALCLGVTLFLLVTILLNYEHGRIHSAIEPKDVPMLYIAIAIGILLAFVSNTLFKNKVAQIDMSAPAKARFIQYQTASILRFAPLEAAGLFNVVAWYLTGNVICAFVGGAVILYMISLRPVKRKVIATLQISYPDTLD